MCRVKDTTNKHKVITSKRLVEKLVQVGHVAETSDNFGFDLSITLQTECIHYLQHQ